MKRLCLLALVSVTACGDSPARVPIVFDPDSLEKHRLRGERTVEAAEAAGGASEVDIMVTVSPEGEVTSAAVEERAGGPQGDHLQALAAARAWKFRPFHYRGRAVPARGTVTIRYRHPPRWRDPKASFPPIDYSSLRISLVRSACYGSCPDYRVTIDGSGAVLFATRASPFGGAAGAHRRFGPPDAVLLPGEHRARIDRATLDTLIERFRSARFFGLEREYRAMITDSPTYVLTFTSAGRSWSVIDYRGERAGMPPVVTELEEAVDQAAGTARWVTGDETTVAALKSEGFDFRSPRAAKLAYLALSGTAPDETIIGLVEAGVSPDRPLALDGGERAAPLGETLLVGAVGKHRPRLFDYLAKRGWLSRVPRERLSEIFAESGGGCDPGVARALVAAGADPKARAKRGVGMDETPGASALIAAVAPYGPCSEVELKPVVAGLLAVGVDANSADDAGRTVLYGLEDPELQEQLLAAGARADVRDRKGNSPAFSSRYDRIVLGLLDAGADPDGRDGEGKSLRELAKAHDMPSVLKWLDSRAKSR